ncbi:MAG: hypothetical protein IKT81_02650 [Clostridia bacterium]|nr:hypothetical protein [Clostridia bacterium]
MTPNQAIQRADELRPNALSRDTKLLWLGEIEGQVGCLMGREEGVHTDPDGELLMQPPFDNIYYLYLCARIDHAHQDGDLYYNDTVMFNASFDRAKSHYRQQNLPQKRGNWRIC